MKITVTTPKGFLHGRQKFKEGETYDVPDTFAGYFIGSGWAVEADKDQPVTQKIAAGAIDWSGDAPTRRGKDLEIQDVHKGHSVPKLGMKKGGRK